MNPGSRAQTDPRSPCPNGEPCADSGDGGREGKREGRKLLEEILQASSNPEIPGQLNNSKFVLFPRFNSNFLLLTIEELSFI